MFTWKPETWTQFASLLWWNIKAIQKAFLFLQFLTEVWELISHLCIYIYKWLVDFWTICINFDCWEAIHAPWACFFHCYDYYCCYHYACQFQPQHHSAQITHCSSSVRVPTVSAWPLWLQGLKIWHAGCPSEVPSPAALHPGHCHGEDLISVSKPRNGVAHTTVSFELVMFYDGQHFWHLFHSACTRFLFSALCCSGLLTLRNWNPPPLSSSSIATL